MFNLSLKTHTTDHLEITVTPEKWFKNIPTDHILTQIIKDHFTFLYGQKHKNEPFVKLLVNSRTMADLVYTVDNKLSTSVKTLQTSRFLNMTNLKVIIIIRLTKVNLKKLWTSLNKCLQVSSRLLEKNKDNLVDNGLPFFDEIIC